MKLETFGAANNDARSPVICRRKIVVKAVRGDHRFLISSMKNVSDNQTATSHP